MGTKVWVLHINFVKNSEEIKNDVDVFLDKNKALEEFNKIVDKSKEKSKELDYEIFLDENTAFESYWRYDENNNHIYIRLFEKLINN